MVEEYYQNKIAINFVNIAKRFFEDYFKNKGFRIFNCLPRKEGMIMQRVNGDWNINNFIKNENFSDYLYKSWGLGFKCIKEEFNSIFMEFYIYENYVIFTFYFFKN